MDAYTATKVFYEFMQRSQHKSQQGCRKPPDKPTTHSSNNQFDAIKCSTCDVWFVSFLPAHSKNCTDCVQKHQDTVSGKSGEVEDVSERFLSPGFVWDLKA